MAITVNKGS